MYKKFNLNLDVLRKIKSSYDRDWIDLVCIGRSDFESRQKLVECDLNKFANPDGSLQAEEIINSWFPSIDADIFVSHSHKDEELVLGLAGWLKKNFGLTTFIDSVVWGYSDTLLKVIDDNYCQNEDHSAYDYKKRNRSTSHVHMMLSTALMHMIDRCEMFLFIKTQNSFKPLEYFNSSGETESPWIYSELSLVDKLRENEPKRIQEITEARNLDFSMESLKIKYPVDDFSFIPLTFDNLIEWKSIGVESYKSRNLDKLYNMIKG